MRGDRITEKEQVKDDNGINKLQMEEKESNNQGRAQARVPMKRRGRGRAIIQGAGRARRVSRYLD